MGVDVAVSLISSVDIERGCRDSDGSIGFHSKRLRLGGSSRSLDGDLKADSVYRHAELCMLRDIHTLPHGFFFLGVVQLGSSVARQGRMPCGVVCRLALASSNTALLSLLVIAALNCDTSLLASITDFLNAVKKASAVCICQPLVFDLSVTSLPQRSSGDVRDG